MAKTEKRTLKTSTKRYGPRYGPRLKNKVAQIEAVQRSWQTCPYCRKPKVKRLSMGIWHCRKCQKTFSGKAYSIKEKFFKEEETAEEEAPQNG